MATFIVYPFDLKAMNSTKSGEPLPANPSELRVFNGNTFMHSRAFLRSIILLEIFDLKIYLYNRNA